MDKTIFNKKELVSIIMPSYNSEKTIENAIKSVINQSYPYWELIVIDDGSSDHSFSIIQNFSVKDERVRTIQNKKNMGVSKSRNLGIEKSKGDWIAFLDSDDMWVEKKLEKQIFYAHNHDALFIFTGSSYINADGEYYKGKLEVPNIINYRKLIKQNVISCSSVLIHKKCIGETKIENDEMHEDYAFWLKILKKGFSAFGLNEPLLIYRIDQNSKSGNKIKSVKMTYKVFRHLSHNYISSIYLTIRHTLGATMKYVKIKKCGKRSNEL